MQVFNKSYTKWKFFNDRDLLYKLNIDNLHNIPKINQFIIKQNLNKPNDIFSNMSLNILLFDEYPLILKVNNTIDNKKKNTILGTKLTLSKLKFFSFFLRLKTEEGVSSLNNKFKFSSKNSNLITFHFNLNLFDEFLFLYDKYPILPDISITLKFVNCKKMEEKQLLLKNFLLI